MIRGVKIGWDQYRYSFGFGRNGCRLRILFASVRVLKYKMLYLRGGLNADIKVEVPGNEGHLLSSFWTKMDCFIYFGDNCWVFFE